MGSDTQRRYVAIAGYSKNILTVVEKNNADVHREVFTIEKLDTGLLEIFDEQSYDTLDGVAVETAQLGGFAASRLIISTLNALCWLKNIPLIEYDGGDVDAVFAQLESMHSFGKPLVPRYSAPPDITPSKKKPEFIVES